MDAITRFIQTHKAVFEAVQALNAVVSLAAWCIGGLLLYFAWRRNGIRSVSVGSISFQMQGGRGRSGRRRRQGLARQSSGIGTAGRRGAH